MPDAMSDDAVRAALSELSNWRLQDGKLRRELRFDGFPEALAFLVRVGIEAEKRGHHPELANVYDRVTVELVSHDAGGVTDRDLELARAIDGIAPA